MKKPNIRLGVVIFIMILIEVVCSKGIEALNAGGLYITIDKDISGVMFVYHGIIGLLSILFIVGLFKNDIIKGIIGFILVFIVGWICIMFSLSYNYWNYRYYKSPNGNNEIIIRDNGLFLFSGEAQVLKKKNRFLSELVVIERTDEDNTLESNFTLKWIDNDEAIFTYKYFGDKTVTEIKFENDKKKER